jgi:hypothetical protein
MRPKPEMAKGEGLKSVFESCASGNQIALLIWVMNEISAVAQTFFGWG